MDRIHMAPGQRGGNGWAEQGVRHLLQRREREGNDGTRRGPGNQVVGGREEGGQLKC